MGEKGKAASFPQLLADVNTKGTVTEASAAERHRERTQGGTGILFEALHEVLHPNISCWAKGFKLRLVANEIFGTI